MNTLTDERRAKLEGWRDECEAALQKLATGGLRAQVEFNGEKVAFTQTNMGDLRRRLQEIRSELGEVKSAYGRGIRV